MAFHRDQIKTYGGKQGVRVDGLLESVLAQPQSPFEGNMCTIVFSGWQLHMNFIFGKNHPLFIEGRYLI